VNWGQFEGGWKRYKADIQRYWPLLTDVQLDAVAGDRDRLLDALGKAYGMNPEQATEQLANWQASRQREAEPLERRVNPR